MHDCTMFSKSVSHAVNNVNLRVHRHQNIAVHMPVQWVAVTCQIYVRVVAHSYLEHKRIIAVNRIVGEEALHWSKW